MLMAGLPKPNPGRVRCMYRGNSNSIPRNEIPVSTNLEFAVAYIRARFGGDERGASLVEYALLVALIAVVCIVAVTFLGTAASSKFSTLGSSINT